MLLTQPPSLAADSAAAAPDGTYAFAPPPPTPPPPHARSLGRPRGKPPIFPLSPSPSLSLSLPLGRPHNFGVQLSRDFGAGRFIWSVLCFDEAAVAVTYLLSVPVTDIGKRGRGLEETSEIGDRGHAASGMLILKVNKQRDQCPFQKANGCVNFTVKLGVRFGKACVGVG